MQQPACREFAIYLRKSRGRTGIARQRAITAGCIGRLGGTVAAEFTDTDATAFHPVGAPRPERAGFDAMLDWLTGHPGAPLAAWHADRLVRSSGDTEMLIAVCAAGGHLIVTPRGGSYDLSTATGRKRLRADANDAAFEVDHMTERIIDQKAEAAAAGLWLGGPVPFGWRRDGAGLALDAAAAAAITQATLAIPAGVSLNALARRWNAAGLTRTRGRPWRPSEVRRVLLRARNAGLYVHQGALAAGITGQWPPVVTGEQWRACRAILLDPARRTSPGPGRRHLGSGLYVCSVCGGTLTCSTASGPGGSRVVYRCRQGEAGSRGHVARDAASLDAFAAALVIAWLEGNPAALRLRRPGTQTLQAELSAVRSELRLLPELKNQGALTLDQVVTMTGPLRTREAALDAAITRARQPSVLGPFGEGTPAAVWDRLDLDRRRAVLAALVTITVHPSPKGRPAGWKPGASYLRKEAVSVTWKQASSRP